MPAERLGSILLERNLISRADLSGAAGDEGFLENTLRTLGLLEAEAGGEQGREQDDDGKSGPAARPSGELQHLRKPAQAIKVKTERLDNLLLLVGEMVTLHQNLAHLTGSRDDDELSSVSDRMERLLRDLRVLSMELHMIPIGNLFSTYHRSVRDIAHQCGKKVRLLTRGEDTEFDRTLYAGLTDPLLHLIRNAVDHGIEAPGARRKAGKDPEGTVRLEAFYKGTSGIIRVADDGAGIDPRGIRKKAIEKGLIAETDSPTDSELLDLLFEPGFSTAETVSSVSGRGVGMDVVRKSIQNLKGRISIDTESGKGTTVTISLPLTLASTESLLFAVCGTKYLIPLSYISECVFVDTGSARTGKLEIHGEMMSTVSLGELFACGAGRFSVRNRRGGYFCR